MERAISRRSWATEISSAGLALLIALVFALDWFFHIDPRGYDLAWCLVILNVGSLFYVILQLRPVLARINNDSAEVGSDTLFSPIPAIILIAAALLKAVLYFIYMPRDWAGPGGWFQWISGFWTPLEWAIFLIVLILMYIDIGLFSNTMNRITMAGRAEGRIAG